MLPPDHVIDRLCRDAFTEFTGPKLTGHPDFLTGNTTVDDTLSNAGLIKISVRCIEMAVSCLQCSDNSIMGSIVQKLSAAFAGIPFHALYLGTKSQLRHLDTVA